MTFVDLKPPAEPAGRVLACVRCGTCVEVYEAPDGWIDDAAYVCIPCLGGDPHERKAAQ